MLCTHRVVFLKCTVVCVFRILVRPDGNVSWSRGTSVVVAQLSRYFLMVYIVCFSEVRNVTGSQVRFDGCLFIQCELSINSYSAGHHLSQDWGWGMDTVQCESKKIPPRGVLTFFIFFTNGWEFLIDFLHTYYRFLSTLDYKFLFNYPQFWRSYAILSVTTQFT